MKQFPQCVWVCVPIRIFMSIATRDGNISGFDTRSSFWIFSMEVSMSFLSMGTVHVHVCGRVCACVQPPCLIFFSQATLPTYTPKSPSLSFKASHSPEKCHHKGKGRDKARGMVVWVLKSNKHPRYLSGVPLSLLLYPLLRA